jgi:3-hydroxybutyryl-CoA dehydrogenase
MEIKNIVIVGMGIMGSDIALAFSMAGCPVTGIDIDPKVLDQAAKKIAANCQQMVEWGLLLQEEMPSIRSRVALSLDWDQGVRDADYITEAVPEVMDLKQKVLKRCAESCREDVVIASNTSTMDITKLARDVKNPQRVIGTHWFIPAHLMPPVEVVRGNQTSESTARRAFDLLKRVGKSPVACKNHPGFIHNYIQMAMVNAAIGLVEKGIATPEDVDTVIENGFGLRLPTTGPFKFIDMAGLDTIQNALDYLYTHTDHPIYKPPRILEEKVKGGELGQKTGRGFYHYGEGEGQKRQIQTNRGIALIKKALGKG